MTTKTPITTPATSAPSACPYGCEGFSDDDSRCDLCNSVAAAEIIRAIAAAAHKADDQT